MGTMADARILAISRTCLCCCWVCMLKPDDSRISSIEWAASTVALTRDGRTYGGLNSGSWSTCCCHSCCFGFDDLFPINRTHPQSISQSGNVSHEKSLGSREYIATDKGILPIFFEAKIQECDVPGSTGVFEGSSWEKENGKRRKKKQKVWLLLANCCVV